MSLHLQCETPAAWWEKVRYNVNDLLVDHAHCEKKAAGTAMNLLFAYVEHVELATAMGEIVVEELEHFRQVLGLLARRGIRFCRLKPSAYGRLLNGHVRKFEPGRAIDRLLVAGLIEARSCERFALLRDSLEDDELRQFYGSLFEAEARHHSTYLRLAQLFGKPDEVRVRLHELSLAEAGIIQTGEPLPRMHS